jgi:16S rRNA (guanine527-N7)-methyltransferase
MDEQQITSPAPERAGDAPQHPVSTEALRAYLGTAYDKVAEFHDLLAQEGVTRGLIGPREAPRLWERHLMNSAAVAPFLPATGSVVDIGSGAGLPGVVLAAMRPDLHVVLLEPMERRVTWLMEVVSTLGLTSVEVVRGRADELHGKRLFDAVTARAVAPLDRLVTWSLPLLRQGGVLVALKGSQAAQELEAARSAVEAAGGGIGEVLEARTVDGIDPTTVIRVERRAPAVVQKQVKKKGAARQR